MIMTLAAAAQKSFVVKGKIAKEQQGKIILSYKRYGLSVLDTASVTDGEFQFKGTVGDPSYALLSFGNNGQSQADYQSFFLEGLTTEVSSTSGLADAVIKGGKAQADFEAYGAPLKPQNVKMRQLMMDMKKYRDEADDAALMRAQGEADKIQAGLKLHDSLYIRQNPGSFVALALWANKHRGIADPEVEPAFLHFSKELRTQSWTGQEFARRLAIGKKLDKGKAPVDFTLKDVEGKAVTLSSLKGKNVLLLFWYDHFSNYQSVLEQLNRIHQDLKGKNFTIVAVGYQMSSQKWKEHIYDLSIDQWIHLSDLDGIEGDSKPVSEVAKAYGLTIDMLPQAYLIGKDGRIVKRHVRLWDGNLASIITDSLQP